jgi:hypothetical protein
MYRWDSYQDAGLVNGKKSSFVIEAIATLSTRFERNWKVTN